jgi:hypothetical protein
MPLQRQDRRRKAASRYTGIDDFLERRVARVVTYVIVINFSRSRLLLWDKIDRILRAPSHGDAKRRLIVD